jgi:hypothetical protein
MSEIQLRIQQIVQSCAETRSGRAEGREAPGVMYYMLKSTATLMDKDGATAKASAVGITDAPDLPIMSVRDLYQFLKTMAWAILKPFRAAENRIDCQKCSSEYCMRCNLGELPVWNDHEMNFGERPCANEKVYGHGCVEALMLFPSICASLANLSQSVAVDPDIDEFESDDEDAKLRGRRGHDGMLHSLSYSSLTLSNAFLACRAI